MRTKTVQGILWMVLSLFVVAALGLQVQGEEGVSVDMPAVYEAIFVNEGAAELSVTRLDADLPAGTSYVGLAAGSQVRGEALRSDGRLTWTGPFVLPPGDQLVLRFWLAPGPAATQAPDVEVVAWTVGGGTLQAAARPAALPALAPAVVDQATGPEAVTVEKIAETTELPPDGEPWVAYVVTFTNSISTPATLDWITDTLASGFEFVGMAVGSDVAVQPIDPQAATMVWQGPFIVPGDGTLRLRYWVKALLELGVYPNTVEASGAGIPVGPATANVTVLGPDLEIQKAASPETLTTGQAVTYDVIVENEGNYLGVVEAITDSLPAGFAFEAMAPGSAITATPAIVGGDLVWTGPYTVPIDGEMHLIYQVRSGGTGVKTNSVVARVAGGQVFGPATAQVDVGPAYVMLPGVWHNVRQSLAPSLEETFDTGVPAEWTPFVNYSGLDDDFWFWSGGTGWGRYDFSPDAVGSGYRGWGLSMYLAEEAEGWRDYRVEATLRTSRGAKHTLAGLWVRGTRELQTDLQGGDLTGYYLVLKPDDDKLYLGKIPASNPRLQAIEWQQSATHTPGIEDFQWYDLVVQVEGARIQAWLDGVKLIDWTDPDPWQEGTIGLITYTNEGAQYDYLRVSGPE